ncbi:MAG: flagellar type III secretion system pore protein FliP [Phycisphaerales bacterium]|nr:flagellar type III secretion system pore protein FliP [Phycisphaerales bacterium]
MRNHFRGWKLIGVAAIAAVLSVDAVALAEPAGPPLPSIVDGRAVLPTSGAGPVTVPGVPAEFSLNPLDVLDGAVRSVGPGGLRGAVGGAGPEAPTGQGLSAALNVLILLTVISLAPSIMLMTTCFVRIIVVLGLLKQALGAQSIPPPQVIVALAMFMTLLVMAPTLDRINTEALQPYRAGVITDHEQLWARAREPVRDFMFTQIEATGNWSSLYMVLDYRGIDVSEPEKLTRGDVDMISLIPAFMLSELKTAFLMGFKVYLPFLVIDMVISSLLISMSMMMLPPVLISLPFKLLLFVLVDGWQLIVGSLMSSFGRPAALTASAVGQSVLPGFLPVWG